MGSHVVIIGGGYAGVSAATHLARNRRDLAVTVVNERSSFVERIRLHQLIAGNDPASHDLRRMLPPRIDLIADRAVSIDTAGRRVNLAAGSALAYDHLIYAVGSTGPTTTIDGAEHAVALGTFEDAQAARVKYTALHPGSTITVIGGGLAGVETAAELAALDEGHTIRVVTAAGIAPSVRERARAHIRAHFDSAGIALWENTEVVRIDPDHLTLADGETISTDLTILASGVSYPDIARVSGLTTAPSGALAVANTLVSVDDPTVVGAGDAIAIADLELRDSCQAAVPLGVHAADTVLRLLAGRSPRAVEPKFVGQAVSLGRRDGVMQLSNRADEPWRTVISGRLGAVVKAQICSATLRFGHFGRFGYKWV